MKPSGPALVTQARLYLAGAARLHKVIFDKGFLDGSMLWWIDWQGITCGIHSAPFVVVL